MLLTATLILASITDTLADWVTGVVQDMGLPGIFILMAPESACIPIPSEPTMLFAGFAVSEGEYSVFAAAMTATVANLVGSIVAWYAGFRGRTDLLEKQKFVHISPKHLEWADNMFAKYGYAAVFFSRMLPIVRTFISLPAGVARMKFWPFAILTFLGAFPWNLGLVLAGKAARDDWDDLKDKLHYIDYAVAAIIVLTAVYLAQRWWRNRGRGKPAPDAG